jgi:hypothetical protein
MFGFSPFAAAPFADTGAPSENVTVELVGVEASCLSGSVEVAAKAQVYPVGVEALGLAG